MQEAGKTRDEPFLMMYGCKSIKFAIYFKPNNIYKSPLTLIF